MPIVTPSQLSPVAVRQARKIFSGTVIGGDGNPAVGRTVLAIGRTVTGGYEIKGTAATGAEGRYTLDIPGGSVDRFVLVFLGDPALDEHCRALGNMGGS